MRLSTALRLSSRLISNTRNGLGTCTPSSALPDASASASTMAIELLPVDPIAAIALTVPRNKCLP